MKYDTQMSREDMINHINELEARLKSQDEPTLKRFDSHDDFISYLVEQGLLDIPTDNSDEECHDCNQDNCEDDEPDDSLDRLDRQILETTIEALGFYENRAKCQDISHHDTLALCELIRTIKGID